MCLLFFSYSSAVCNLSYFSTMPGSKMRANGVRASPMDGEQLLKIKLAMDHLGSLQ